MFHIFHDIYIQNTKAIIYDAISNPSELEKWWPLKCSGKSVEGSTYQLFFGEGYDWQAKVIKAEPGVSFHMKMTLSDPDWQFTSFGFDLQQHEDGVWVEFWHKNWPRRNQHFRRSSFCWAMLLNGLKDYVEKGVAIPFEQRS